MAINGKAGAHRPALAQRSAFAAEARPHAGLVCGHTELATRVVRSMTVERAAAVTHRSGRYQVVDEDVPAYEVWRRRIMAELVQSRVTPASGGRGPQ